MNKYEYEFRALGTSCSITIIAQEDSKLNDIINKSYNTIISFENEFSRFKDDSILNKLNREKYLEIGDDFWFLVNKSKEIFSLTNGYFNPLVNVSNIGYSHNFNDDNFVKSENTENLSFDEVKLYGNLLEIGENMNLDFGSIAKGYLAEKISNFISEKGFENNLVNMGGDIYASGTNLEGGKWKIAISNPKDTNEAIEEIEISNKSVSTSGTYLRNWEIDEKNYHHIKNPYSDSQEQELVSATIIHEHGYFTDAIATAVIAMGKNKAIDFCLKNNIGFLFILNNGMIIKKK